MARCPETTADDNRHEHSSTSATTTSRHVATPSTCSTVLVDARALPVNVRPVLVSPRTLIDDEQDMDTNDDMHTIDDMNDHAESRPLLLTPRDDTHDRETHLYPRRWLLLATFCLLTSSSAFLWITFAPRIELFLGFFGVASDRPLAVNAMSLVFMAAFPVFCVPWLGWLTTGSRSAVDSAQRNVDDRVKSGRSESYCSNSHSTDADKSAASTERPSVTPAMDQGLRNAVLSGAIIDAIATLLRWLGCRASSRSYPLVLAGQTLAALGQIPILATPPKLASTWFGVTERNTACALALGANSVGIAVGFVASLALPERYDAVGGTSDGVIEAYMFWQFVICTAIAASCVLFFRESSPPTPPSLSTALEHHCHDAASSSALISPSTHVSSWRQLVRGVKLVSQRRSFWSMTLSTGISLGAYFGLQAVLDELLAPIFVDGNGGDIGHDGIAYVGFAFVLAGIISTIACGWYLDRTLRYRSTIRFLHIFSFISLLLAHLYLIFFLDHATTSRTTSFIIVSALIIVYGVCVAGIMPAAFQGASDMFYPSSDFIVSVALNLAGNIGGSAAMLFLSALDRRGGGEANASGVYTMVDSMSVLVGLVGVGVLVAFQVDGTLHRTACDADVPISE